MLRRFSTIFALSFLLFAFMGMTAFAAKSPVDKRAGDKRINKAVYYSYPDATKNIEPSSGTSIIPLGKSSLSRSASAVFEMIGFQRVILLLKKLFN